MKLEVLHVSDCPNLRPLLDRLAEATDLPITTREVTTDDEADRLGMNGSPTLLINGIDPFASADQCACGVSCRLYRDQEGRIVPAPSVDHLRNALAEAISASERSDIEPGEVLSLASPSHSAGPGREGGSHENPAHLRRDGTTARTQ